MRNVLGFFDFFRRRKKNNEIKQGQTSDELLLDEGKVILRDVHSAIEREEIVLMHCEKMNEASRELERLDVEYQYVTNSLLDCDEIENFPQLEKEDLAELAKKIKKIDDIREERKSKRQKLSRAQFLQMEKYEDEMPGGLERLEEAESYQDKIKKDLVKLNGEKQAYLYRREELIIGIENAKGMAKICFVALVICFSILLLLRMFLEMDIQIGALLATGIAAIAITVFFSRFLDYSNELKRIESGINRLIVLQNKVKIRYINNVNLLDYMYIKYAVSSGKELRKNWDYYEEEQYERKRFEQTKEELDILYKKVLQILMRNKISDTSVWLHQTEAFLDSREMVEVRHGLNVRRQKLRDQMDQNTEIAEKSKKEIKKMVDENPKYAKRILEIVEDFENKS